jgi:predicted HD superfamily hydrolase involved in NAD metabolism
MNTEDYTDYLECILTPHRFQHSLDVMEVMGELAEVYQLDRTQAMTAGLLHDAAKDLEPEQLLALAEEARIEFRHPCERLPVYLHAPVSAYLVSKELGITDSLILDAISTHSYFGVGDNFDGPFSWCLRSADLVEPGREWKGVKRLRSVVYAGRLEEAALLQCSWLIKFLPEIGIPVHPNLIESFRLLSTMLNAGEAFCEREET